MWLHPDGKVKTSRYCRLSQSNESMVCQILRHHGQAGHYFQVMKISRTTTITLITDALDIDFRHIGNIVDSVLRPLDALVLPGVAIFDFGDSVALETVQLNISMQ